MVCVYSFFLRCVYLFHGGRHDTKNIRLFYLIFCVLYAVVGLIQAKFGLFWLTFGPLYVYILVLNCNEF